MSVRKSSKFDSIISCLELGFRFHIGGTRIVALLFFFIFSLKSLVFDFRVLQDTVFLDKKFSINESSIKCRG